MFRSHLPLCALSIAGALTLFGPPALAQGPAAPTEAERAAQAEGDRRALNEAVKPTAMASRVGSGLLSAEGSIPAGFEINADEGASTVTLKWSKKIPGAPTGEVDYFSALAKAPLEKNGDSIFGALTGLGNATSVEVKYTHTQIRGVHSLRAADVATNRNICLEAVQAYKDAHDQQEPSADLVDCSTGYIDSEFLDENAPNRYDEHSGLFRDAGAYLLLYGVSGAIGTENFKYRNPTSLAEVDQNKQPWSVSAYLSYEPIALQTLFTLKAEHRRVYKALDSEVRCPTPGSTVGCVEGAFGPPKEEKTDVLSLEVRRRLAGFGIALTTRWDVDEDTVAVDLPVYFVRDTAGGFNGGVRASWNSKDDDVIVGVFVSKAFSLHGDL